MKTIKTQKMIGSSKIKKWKTILRGRKKTNLKIKETKDYYYVDDPKCDKEICPFCGSERYGGGGSWSPDGCLDCGAIHWFSMWFKDKERNNEK